MKPRENKKVLFNVHFSINFSDQLILLTFFTNNVAFTISVSLLGLLSVFISVRLRT